MLDTSRNRAEIEYAVMLAVLDFQTQYMKSHYTRATVHLVEDLIEITLAKTSSIPAEDRLGESPEGRAILQQVHASLFMSGESLLRHKLERELGTKIRHLYTFLNIPEGTNTIIIKLDGVLDGTSA